MEGLKVKGVNGSIKFQQVGLSSPQDNVRRKFITPSKPSINSNRRSADPKKTEKSEPPICPSDLLPKKKTRTKNGGR